MAGVYSSPRVLASAEAIADAAKDVSVDTDRVPKVAARIVAASKRKRYDWKAWRAHPLHPSEASDAAVAWILVVDTLNFSFWHDDPAHPFTVAYRGETYTGYWSLCAAINRALDDQIPVTDATFLASISDADIRKIFRSETATDAPMLCERRQNLQELGAVLLKHFNGSALELVQSADCSAQALISLVCDKLPSFRDECEFQGRPVLFLKRAQILVADLWACFQGAGPGRFDDISTITMFADYRVPQCLAHFGLLKYSPVLLDLLAAPAGSTSELVAGHRLECEIRGCSIWAVELLRQEVARQMTKDAPARAASPGGADSRPPGANNPETSAAMNSVILDFFLWDFAKEHGTELAHIPIHRIRTVAY